MTIQPYFRKASYYETDQMGIIHHSNYIRWFEDARVDLMEQMGYGYERAAESGIDFVLIGLSCEYKSMVRFGDSVLICVEEGAVTPSRMSLYYTVRDAKTNELRATGETRHCYFSRKTGRPASLKKELPELYALIMGLTANQYNIGYK